MWVQTFQWILKLVKVNHLIKNPNCNKVTSIGRKSVNGNVTNDKLVDVVIESLFFLDSTLSYWEGNDIFFNCIGTTKKRAGNAQNFVDIMFYPPNLSIDENPRSNVWDLLKDFI